jgi:hypothetical protein
MDGRTSGADSAWRPPVRTCEPRVPAALLHEEKVLPTMLSLYFRERVRNLAPKRGLDAREYRFPRGSLYDG